MRTGYSTAGLGKFRINLAQLDFQRLALFTLRLKRSRQLLSSRLAFLKLLIQGSALLFFTAEQAYPTPLLRFIFNCF